MIKLARRAVFLVAVVNVFACGGEKPAAATPAADNSSLVKPVVPLPASSGTLDKPQPSAAANPAWKVTARGVGPLVLGAAVPEPAAGFETSYATTFYADAQPLEGFQFADPPAGAFVKGGPFSKWGYDHPGEEAPAKVKQRAVGLARTGKLPIDMIVITDPRPKTQLGIGVGDPYTSFAKSNPAATKLQRFPGLWEEPSCVVSEETVWYFFDHCDAPDQAKLLRIVVRMDDQGQDTPSRPVKNERGLKGEKKSGEKKGGG
jgi:hypothetical protein